MRLFSSSSFIITGFLATTTAVVWAVLPHLESRDDEDPNLFTLSSSSSEVPDSSLLVADGGSGLDSLGTAIVDGGLGSSVTGDGDDDGGLSNLDSSALLTINPDEQNGWLFDDLGGPNSLGLPGDDMTIADSLVSSCLDPASRKRDLSDEDLLLLGRKPLPHHFSSTENIKSHPRPS